MIPFDFQPRTRIVFGPDTVDELGQLAADLRARRAIVVSDEGVIQAGHTDRGLGALRRAGIDAELFSGFHENPKSREVEDGCRLAREFQPDLIIGLGGGSSMDCAKGMNFVFSNGGAMRDYWGVGKAEKPMLPMIAVPTTAGTGSETQSFALISDSETHAKMACGDPKAACRIAVLDPRLTVTQPAGVTALTGVDALAHALETYVTKRRNSVSLAFSREAWRLLAGNFTRVLDDPEELEARGAMQLGASFAGLAIENSMLGAAHALANPLTARYGTVHGQAVGIMLPHVIRFNGEQFADWYVDLLEASGHQAGIPHPKVGPEGLADFVTELVAHSGLHTRLSDCAVDQADFDELAEDAASQWTGTFNPRHVEAGSLRHLYEQAF